MLGQNCFPSLSNCWRYRTPDVPEMNVTAEVDVIADKKTPHLTLSLNGSLRS